jgi:hypothetical protein
VSNLAPPHSRLKPRFARVKPFTQAGKYMSALMSDLPRKNGWTIAVHAGDLTPDPTRRLLNHAVWDHDQAQGVVRRYVAEIKRLFNLATRQLRPETHHLYWIWWRRRHNAGARWFHHHTRLRRQIGQT